MPTVQRTVAPELVQARGTCIRIGSRIINTSDRTGGPAQKLLRILFRIELAVGVGPGIGEAAAVLVSVVPLDRVSQLDHVRHDGLVVRLEFWTVPTWGKEPCAAEQLEEEALEFAPEDDVDDEVDAAVDGHQQVAHLDHPIRRH